MSLTDISSLAPSYSHTHNHTTRTAITLLPLHQRGFLVFLSQR